MYRVVLVDDEHIILKGLKKIFPWAEYQCEVVGTATDGLDGLKLIRQLQPHIVLTDIRMPNMNGLEMIAALKSEFPQIQISILTAFHDFEYAQQALNFGVCRYMLKPSKMSHLKEAFQCMVDNLAKSQPPVIVKEDPAKEAFPPEEAAVQDASNFIVGSALQYIENHYKEHITLSDVADNVYVSQWHLSKLINRHLSKSFFDIVNGLRIDHAKKLLTTSTLKVHEIGLQLGYSDSAHFSKNFKNLVGASPLEYRNRKQRT